MTAERARQILATGQAAWNAGRIEEAASAFAGAALLNPADPQAHGNLGVALRRLGRPEAAIASYRRALALAPEDAATHSNLGNALREIGRLEESETHLARAVQLAPANAMFLYNLALVVRDRRRLGEALERMEALAAANPDNGDIAWDVALTRLQMKDYQRGLAGYESRWRLARSPPRQMPGERWTGGDVAGKTLFLHAEQGFGDALQFVRFVPEIARRGARVVLECQPELLELFAHIPGVVQVVAKGSPPPAYDLWDAMLSLPYRLGVTWETLPGQVPYLYPPRRLAKPLGRPPGASLNVGLIWAGKTTPRDRSWPLLKLAPLFEESRAAFFSFQLGPRAADLGETGMGRLMRDLGPSLKSFADTAALMSEMDLIVTIDTSAAHLAGALGRPTFVLLRYVSDWRWLDEPEDSAWYPSLRLFRQPQPDDFDTPVAGLKEALNQMLDERS